MSEKYQHNYPGQGELRSYGGAVIPEGVTAGRS